MTHNLIEVSFSETGGIKELIMPRTANWHAHLRNELLCQAVAPIILRPHKYVLVMPNTGPITTIEQMRAYYDMLRRICDEFGYDVELVMTLYFTELLTPAVIEEMTKLGFRSEVKYYPPHPGATTGSGRGVPLSDNQDALFAMRDCGIPLLGHFESVEDRFGHELPHLKREEYFLREEYPRFRDANPDLRVCIEHASTDVAVDIVKADLSGKTVLTITPHHLLFLLREIMKKSWRNHGRCMPYIKDDERHRRALRDFAFSGDPRAIAGDDTAPHLSQKKLGNFEEAACGCWLPHAIGLYILAAYEEGALNDNFVKFMCFNGADWRGLPRPSANERLRVVGCASPDDIPEPLPVPGTGDVVIPLGWTEEADRLQIGFALADQMHCSH